jgi:hypothetical protein
MRTQDGHVMLRRYYCQSLLFLDGCTAKTRKFMQDDMIVITVLSTVLLAQEDCTE